MTRRCFWVYAESLHHQPPRRVNGTFLSFILVIQRFFLPQTVTRRRPRQSASLRKEDV